MVASLPKNKAHILAYGALLLATLCWGMAPVATRYLLTSFTPVQLVLVRFLVSALLFLPLLASVRRYQWNVKKIAWIVFCGITGVIGYNVPVAYGLRVIPSSLGGLLIATEPIWIILIAACVLREKITWSVVMGLLLSCVDILLLFSQEYFDASWNIQLLTGALLILLAAIMWSIYTVSVRMLSKELGARTATALTMVVGTLPLLTLWDTHILPLLGHINGMAWIALALLTVGSTIAATILWNYGVVYATSSRASLFLYLVPLISVAGGTLFLHEHISIMTFVSGLLILGGVALAQLIRPGRVEE